MTLFVTLMLGEDIPQVPIFPQRTTLITPELAFERRDERVVYLNGHLPVYTHEVKDLASFLFITTQLIINGTARGWRGLAPSIRKNWND
jgi:hypothetical protein